MSVAVNPNLRCLVDSYNAGQKGVVLEGSSRSGKTWSGIDFLVFLCVNNKGLKIAVVRETYNSFKTTLYVDFEKRLDQYGLRHPFGKVKDVSSFFITSNQVFLIGADNVSTKIGAGFDIVFFNEAIHIPRKIFDNLEMRRCRFWWMDYNPEVSEHWIYDSVITRKDVSYLKTTFKDNPFCPTESRAKILSYEPTPENIAQGTADEYMWTVYGLGEKAELKGRIYPRLYSYEELPTDAWFVGYGGDFGFSPDPTVIVAVWKLENDLFIREMVYGTELHTSLLADMMRQAGIRDYTHDDPDDIVMDSAEPITIAELKRTHGFRIWKPKKGSGSVQANIRMLSQYRLHIHEDSKNVRRDFENFCWKWNELTDGPTGEPEKRYKHSNDAVAYVVSRAIGREE